MDIRTAAIEQIVETLRELEATATRVYEEQNAAANSLTYYDSTGAHRVCADENWAVASRCEQLIEEITGGLLFDQLDAEDAEYETALATKSDGAL